MGFVSTSSSRCDGGNELVSCKFVSDELGEQNRTIIVIELLFAVINMYKLNNIICKPIPEKP